MSQLKPKSQPAFYAEDEIVRLDRDERMKPETRISILSRQPRTMIRGRRLLSDCVPSRRQGKHPRAFFAIPSFDPSVHTQ